jgi:hypothetical protein
MKLIASQGLKCSCFIYLTNEKWVGWVRWVFSMGWVRLAKKKTAAFS